MKMALGCCGLTVLPYHVDATPNPKIYPPHTAFAMDNSSSYTPPKIWSPNIDSGGRFASINRPVAGATHDKELSIGRHPLQLYSLGTPNGVKVTVMLEELLAAGHAGAEYDAWLIRIQEGDQFGSGFVSVNPNSKIPALVDRSGATPIRVFESGAILVYLAEKFGAFLPTDAAQRAECLSWLFWQMGSAPFLGGGFGHFYAYAPTKIEYPIDRWMCWTNGLRKALTWQVMNTPLPTWRSGPGTARWPWASCTKPVNSCKCKTTKTCCAGQPRSPNGQLCSADAWSTAPLATPPSNCTSATTPATSTPKRRTSC